MREGGRVDRRAGGGEEGEGKGGGSGDLQRNLRLQHVLAAQRDDALLGLEAIPVDRQQQRVGDDSPS